MVPVWKHGVMTLSTVQTAPADPILGMTEAFNTDPRPDKVNLGVGVYQDATGNVPLLTVVRQGLEQLSTSGRAFGYQPIPGNVGYLQQVSGLLFGPDADTARVAMVQGIGGTGALHVAAELLHQANPEARVWISSPSWENHRGIFERAGFEVLDYRYYDDANRRIDLPGMLDDLAGTQPGDLVVLHACCHNPTGYDLTGPQWDEVIEVVSRAGLMPVVDMAYQGFAEGIEADGEVVRKFFASGNTFVVTQSFSKTFSLYGERVGSLSVVCADQEEAARVLSQLKVIVRQNYSNPPTTGAAIVAGVLANPESRATWESELAAMRDRIKQMRQELRDGLAKAVPDGDFDYITTQKGMFSYSGLSREQMHRLREEHGVYGLDSGRICVAALNESNLPTVIKAIAEVVGHGSDADDQPIER